jgi:hypothetical protein
MTLLAFDSTCIDLSIDRCRLSIIWQRYDRTEQNVWTRLQLNRNRVTDIYKQSVTFDFFLFLSVLFYRQRQTKQCHNGLRNSISFSLCRYVDRFILFMFPTVTHDQSTIDKQVSILKIFPRLSFSILSLSLSLVQFSRHTYTHKFIKRTQQEKNR